MFSVTRISCDQVQATVLARQANEKRPCGNWLSSRRWVRRAISLIAPCVVIAGIYATREILLPPLARFLNVGERPSTVDYVMVLGGGSDSRPFLAAAMHKAGLAPTVLVARFKPAPENEDGILPTEDEIILRVLEHQGVSRESVVRFDRECASTRDEAEALATFLRTEPWARVAVVTTNYHTRRARRVFRHELGNLQDQVCFVGVPTESFSEDNWWKSRDGFLVYLNELFKSAYYWARY